MHELTFDSIEAMSGFCVYVAYDEKDAVLYVGRSDNGILRPFDKNHHVLSKHKPHKIRMFPCASSRAAHDLEASLIHELRPIHNRCRFPEIEESPVQLPAPLLPSELKYLRRKMRLTQAGIAKELGVHQVTIANYERGHAVIPQVISLAVRYLSR